jgi:hypothetical protein
MRDPARINIILSKIKEVWTQYPDMRLAQLISNITYREKCDTFNVEDDRLLELLNEISKGLK